MNGATTRPVTDDTDVLATLRDPDVAGHGRDALRELVAAAVHRVEQGSLDPDELWAIGAMHPDPDTRLAVLAAAVGRWERDPEALALVAWSVRDLDDRVAVFALENAYGPDLLDDVFDAAGRSMAALDGLCSGGADLRRRTAVAALVRLLREQADPAAERRRLSWTGYETRQSLRDQTLDTSGMVRVEPGPGVRFAFYLDARPVTVAEYARFVAAVAEAGPVWSHPGQPEGHDHDVLRRLDPLSLERLGDHPVTGVSWYDAWAYAAWRGRRLPSVAQWELAAGHPRRRYPWGDDDPTPTRANLGVGGDVGELLRDWPAKPATRPVGQHPDGNSPEGVQDLIGNVWEWTRSRHLDGQELNPYANPRTPAGADWSLTAAIKGGGWSSPPGTVDASTGAGKFVLHRGPEVGFRCVLEPDGE